MRSPACGRPGRVTASTVISPASVATTSRVTAPRNVRVTHRAAARPGRRCRRRGPPGGRAPCPLPAAPSSSVDAPSTRTRPGPSGTAASRFTTPTNSATNVVAGRGVDLLRRRDLLQPARVEHRHPVRDRQRLGLVVRDEQRGDALGELQPPDLVAQLHPHPRVERRQRLVEQQHRGRHGQRPGQRHPLLLAAGELVRVRAARGRRARRAPAARRRAPSPLGRADLAASAARTRRSPRPSSSGTASRPGTPCRCRAGSPARP